MTMQFSRQGMAARPAASLQARSSLVRRLVQARDDPAKQRIRAWLSDLDDRQLSSLGLTPEDIAVLRGTQSRRSADANENASPYWRMPSASPHDQRLISGGTHARSEESARRRLQPRRARSW
jgi:hypothetical protein